MPITESRNILGYIRFLIHIRKHVFVSVLLVDPVNVTNITASSSSVGLSWKPPDTNELMEPIAEYRLEVVDLLRGVRRNLTFNSSTTNVNLGFLKPFTSYEFQVFGSTSTWQGKITDTISVTTQEDAPSQPPRNFTFQRSTSWELTLEWTPVHQFFINGKLRGYKVKYKKTESLSATWTTVVINVNETQRSRRKRSVADEAMTFNLEGLEAYTNYTVLVLAFTIKDGVPTLATNFTTAQDAPNHAPVNITAHNTSSTRIKVTWQPIPPSHVNGILIGYCVKYRRAEKVNENISMVMVNSTTMSVELIGLGKYKLYSIQVSGRTAVGFGNYSDALFVHTDQDVPDDPPSNIRAIGTEPTVIKAYWLPVWKETRNGVCLGYKLNLFASPGHKIRNYTVSASVLSLEITGLEVWTNYSIKMAAFTIAGVGKWSDAILVDTTEETPNKPPANLTGYAKNSTSISVKWDPPVLPNIRGVLRGYAVYYKEAPNSVHPSMLKNITVDMSVTYALLINLHKYTEYFIWVTAFTTQNGEMSQSISVKTLEDVPDRPPSFITYSSPSSTTVLLNWGSVPPRFKNGIIRGFKIEYQEKKPNAMVEARERMLVNWVFLDNLQKFTVYTVRVRAFNVLGYGPAINTTIITNQDVPSKPPQSITAESQISSRHIHGVLLGYKVRYQVIAVGQEKIEDQPITEIRVNASTLSLVLGNLEVFTLYRIDVVGYTIMGDGPSAWINAETCRCYKRFTTSWYAFQPYVQSSKNDTQSGLIPPILSKLVVTCCKTCKSHGASYVDLNSNGFDQSAELPNSHRLKSSIADPTDFFFPVYGFKDQSHFAEEFGYHGLVESPGMAYIVNTNSHDDMPNAVLMKVVSCWPAMALLFMITYLAGLIIWSVESQYNSRDFPGSFILGASEGFYWAFISMTTVGYGDRAPISSVGRLLAVVVILYGLVIFGLVNSFMATSLTSVTLDTDYKLYGAKVAAIKDSPEYRMGIRKNARMDTDQEYHTFEDIYTALQKRRVIGALIDTYSAGSSRERFEQEHLRVNKILDYSSTYGVVMGKEAKKLRKCFKAYTQHGFANEIARLIQENTKQLKEPPDSLPVEKSTGIFDSQSTLFQRTFLTTTTVLAAFTLVGIIYEVKRRLRARSLTYPCPLDSRKALLVEMREMVEDFNNNIMTIWETLTSRHKQERKNFVKNLRRNAKTKYLWNGKT